MREAVKALEMVRVLDSRPGDGTYVTSLAPRLLLEGFGAAIDLLQDDGGSTDLRTSCEKTYPSGGQQAEG